MLSKYVGKSCIKCKMNIIVINYYLLYKKKKDMSLNRVIRFEPIGTCPPKQCYRTIKNTHRTT